MPKSKTQKQTHRQQIHWPKTHTHTKTPKLINWRCSRKPTGMQMLQTQINTSHTQTLNSKSDIQKPTARLRDTPSDEAVSAEVWESQEVESRLLIYIRLDLSQLFHACRRGPDRAFQRSVMTSFLFRSLNSPSQAGPFSETLPITVASGGQGAMQGWGWRGQQWGMETFSCISCSFFSQTRTVQKEGSLPPRLQMEVPMGQTHTSLTADRMWESRSNLHKPQD